MTPRTFVTFAADYPDDCVFNSSDDIETPGGKAIAESLVTALKNRGISVSEIYQRDYYGWEFSAKHAELTTWLVLQGLDSWLLIIEAHPSLLDRLMLKNAAPGHQALLEMIHGNTSAACSVYDGDRRELACLEIGFEGVCDNRRGILAP